MPDAPAKNQPRNLIYLALAVVTFGVYLPMLRHGFVNYDDPDYILNNAHVNGGLTWSGIVWAFHSSEASNWHPLTWISHMLDCQLFGVNPAGHHLVNLLIHTANTLLLFILLSNLTGAIWRSAIVAALFAWHPLHVESVAWVAERKDVLSAFFFLLTLIAYARFVNLSKVQSPKTKVVYVLGVFAFACALMSKPMAVTLPFVLLLLDFWPLRRFSRSKIQQLLVEKIPFFALTFASCFITMSAQNSARWTNTALSLDFRLANALMSYVRYVAKMFWPTDLAIIYPYPHYWPIAGVITVTVLLAALSVVFVLLAKRFPYLPIGWFWFLGVLVPTIGLVQVGVQSIADRYTYLPSIGLLIVIVWGLSELLNSLPHKTKIAAMFGGAALAGCLAVTSIQLRYWRDSVSLFAHAVDVTKDNYAAYDCLGTALDILGKTDEAGACFIRCVQIEPDYPRGQFNLGMALLEKNRPDEASNHLAIAVQLAPLNPVMQFDFGVFLAQHGKPDEAAEHFQAALTIKPEFPEARQQLELLKTNPPANRSTP
jgi:tetratricopeptide (TPR) repeat protein